MLLLSFDKKISFSICSNFIIFYRKSHKREIIGKWHIEGGVLIVGYDMYRNSILQAEDDTSKEPRMEEILVNPGPDLVIYDEGHLVKNDKTSLSDVLSSIRTMRKIVLTGTPLQNNLDEYFCMVSVVKPYLLGSQKEFKNRFVNPIMNGQYMNSTDEDLKLMKRRSHVLRKLLDTCIHRADISVLEPLLMPKQEYVVYVRLTEFQIKLYKVKMKNHHLYLSLYLSYIHILLAALYDSLQCTNKM